MAELTDSQIDLLRSDKAFAAVATLGDDGSPQTSIVWVDTDGEHVVFNTTNSRAKGRHLRRDPRVSVTVFDRDDPYRYFEVEGAAELELGGADDHIDELSRKYRGEDFDGPRDRVIVKVKPRRIFGYQV
ncbi:MAG TPA: PPOX class F420-dependent oxidoreductase [Gaiellaceae bacterium]|jgi:PPOX class probable F420-dependent enzyme|nr:PPOX class F420-dependent oxidoreductase [Gaiellaceae bacterium]